MLFYDFLILTLTFISTLFVVLTFFK